MSLDVYLESNEFAERQCEHCGSFVRTIGDELYSANITHNLAAMAKEAGIYEALWRPEEIGVTQGGHLVALLRAGLNALEADPDHFKGLNPVNGWGSYDALVRFVRNYLEACEQHRTATVKVSR